MPGLGIERGAFNFIRDDLICRAHRLETLRGHFAEHAHRKAGAGERLALHDVRRQAEHATDFAHFVFEKRAQRFHELERHRFRQAAHVVVRLDLVPGFGIGGLRLDHVGIERSLNEKLDAFEFVRLFFKDRDELVPDADALLFGILDAGEFAQEAFARVDAHYVEMEHVAEGGDDAVAFVRAQETCIDEHAGELRADRAGHERRGHRGIDASGERANDAPAADTFANLRDRAIHLPRRRHARNVVQEVLDHALADLGVRDFGMKLYAVHLARRVADGGNVAARRAR